MKKYLIVLNKILSYNFFIFYVLYAISLLHSTSIMLYFIFIDRIMFNDLESKIEFGEKLITLPIFFQILIVWAGIPFWGVLINLALYYSNLVDKKKAKRFFIITFWFFVIQMTYYYYSDLWTY